MHDYFRTRSLYIRRFAEAGLPHGATAKKRLIRLPVRKALGRAGIESTEKSPEKTISDVANAAKSAAGEPNQAEEFARLQNLWERLSPEVKSGLFSIINASASRSGDEIN